MSDAQAKLGDSLMKNLVAKRQEKGELSLEDVGSILQDVAADLQPGSDESFQLLKSEITKMADYINQAKQEIAALSNKDGADSSDSGISGASVHLDAVIKSTEKASNEIMDAADAIQDAASGVGGDAEAKIMEASTKIYEACNFQDLTGQQINKVVKIITFLDERLAALTSIFSNGEVAASASVASPVATTAAVVEGNVIAADFDEKDLMNGPQLDQPTQDDIDALFDSVDSKPE